MNSFRPSEFQLELTLHRRPDYVSEGSGDGPFIYSALKGRRKEVRQEVAWVIGHTCEVAMEIINPLPVNLRIDEMVRVHVCVCMYELIQVCIHVVHVFLSFTLV